MWPTEFTFSFFKFYFRFPCPFPSISWKLTGEKDYEGNSRLLEKGETEITTKTDEREGRENKIRTAEKKKKNFKGTSRNVISLLYPE